MRPVPRPTWSAPAAAWPPVSTSLPEPSNRSAQSWSCGCPPGGRVSGSRHCRRWSVHDDPLCGATPLCHAGLTDARPHTGEHAPTGSESPDTPVTPTGPGGGDLPVALLVVDPGTSCLPAEETTDGLAVTRCAPRWAPGQSKSTRIPKLWTTRHGRRPYVDDRARRHPRRPPPSTDPHHHSREVLRRLADRVREGLPEAPKPCGQREEGL